ncbi:hypothetical protein V8J36_01200 [Frigidibacter sp. MR17.14]|uniref:hypothetical protein n=1 Tax=Frigidibacter sp. MR17.14 TaxID=3126509 RepID=UPI0030130FE5
MSPITTWDGAEAYFVFADNPALIWATLAGSVAACVWTIVKMATHEAHCAKTHK